MMICHARLCVLLLLPPHLCRATSATSETGRCFAIEVVDQQTGRGCIPVSRAAIPPNPCSPNTDSGTVVESYSLQGQTPTEKSERHRCRKCEITFILDLTKSRKRRPNRTAVKPDGEAAMDVRFSMFTGTFGQHVIRA